MALNNRLSVLVVAGTDSSGGAGIARDVETLSAFRVHASLAVTAVTAQTDQSVEAVEIMPARLVAKQMYAAISGAHLQAVKLGMLATGEIAETVGVVLAKHPDLAVVIDPVLVSSSGRNLMRGDAAAVYGRLFPFATLITPNLPELAMLSGEPIATSEGDMILQAKALMARRARAVLVKGGHADGPEATDLLVTSQAIIRMSAPRLGASMRGTGCALSSAIAANLALGLGLQPSVERAKAYVFERLSKVSDRLPSVDPGRDMGHLRI